MTAARAARLAGLAGAVAMALMAALVFDALVHGATTRAALAQERNL